MENRSLSQVPYYLWDIGIEQATVEDVTAEVEHFVSDRNLDLERCWDSIGEEGRRLYCFLRQAGDWLSRQEIVRAQGPQTDVVLKRLMYYGLVTHDGIYRRYNAPGRLFQDWSDARCVPLLPRNPITPVPIHLSDVITPGSILPHNNVSDPYPAQQYEELQAALLSAYPTRNALKQMLFFRLSVRLDDITDQGNLNDTIFEVLQWVIARGRVEELILQASQYNSNNPELQAFMNAYMFAFAAQVKPISGGKLEAELLKTVAFENIEEWMAKMIRGKQAVCLIEGPKETGTGILVGRDLVLTCYHVIDDVHADPEKWNQVTLRFDYKTDEWGVNVLDGSAYHLVKDPLVAYSPIDQLDFALIRLNEAAGDHEVSGFPGRQRGWVFPQATVFEKGAPLLILQHPKATPLKITAGSILREQLTPKRVIYSTNTLGGSSGAPCFTQNWDLVALHQAGDEVNGNYGIPCSAILPLLPQDSA